MIDPLRHQHLAPVRRRIRRLEGRAVIGDPVAHRAVIAHVHQAQHVAQEDAGHVLDHQVVDPHHAAVGPGQVQPEMPENRLRPPGHVHARPGAGAHDGAHLDHLPVLRQPELRPGLDHAAQVTAPAGPGPGRDAHVRQVAAHGLHPRGHAQVAARQDRRFAHVAQPLRALDLLQFQAAAEILVRRDQRRVHRAVIGIRAGPAGAARPLIQPRLEGRGHEQHAIGDCLVHPHPFRNSPAAALPHGRARFYAKRDSSQGLTGPRTTVTQPRLRPQHPARAGSARR